MDSTDVILAEIKTLKDFFERGFEQNKIEHDRIEKKVDAIDNDYGKRVRLLEDWRLVFVAKYTVYSAIALFLGSIVASVALKLISKYL